MSTHLLGVDVGTSSIKASIIRVADGAVVGAGSSPASELPIASPCPGWAEQDPESWWQHTILAVRQAVAASGVSAGDIKAIGLAYQMHGLVSLDEHRRPVRPAIIWCDSRAVAVGDESAKRLGADYCLEHLMNLPGNFTVSKLLWVRHHEPENYRRIRWAMLPGDYIGLRMTGSIGTTATGLSECIAWDFSAGQIASSMCDALDVPPKLFPPAAPSFAVHGELSAEAARQLGVSSGVPLTYKAGDQPNNAFSLGVLAPGATAASAGTSGVLFGVTERPVADPLGRVNTFVHVNSAREAPRSGVLLCINGIGSANRWLKQTVFAGEGYREIDAAGYATPIGARGLTFLPFGNGSERMLQNRSPGASLHTLDLNRHGRAELARAVAEGVACAFRYGMEQLPSMGVVVRELRAGHSSMFLGQTFREALSSVCGVPLRLLAVDGAQGAARGAGVAAGVYRSPESACEGLKHVLTVEPDAQRQSAFGEVYDRWRDCLQRVLEESV